MKFIELNDSGQAEIQPTNAPSELESGSMWTRIPEGPSKQEDMPEQSWKTMINSMEPVSEMSMGLGGGVTGETAERMVPKARAVLQPVAHAAATVPALISKPLDLVTQVRHFITGAGPKNYEEWQEQPSPIPGIPNKYFLPPTKEQALAGIEKFIGEDYTPKDKYEEVATNIASDLINIGAFGKVPGRLIEMAIAGEGASQLAKYYKQPEWIQGLSKIGTQLGVGLLGNLYDVNKLIKKSYAQRDSYLASNPEITVPAGDLTKKADALFEKLDALPGTDAETVKKSVDILRKKNIEEIGNKEVSYLKKLVDFKEANNKLIGLGKKGKEYRVELTDMVNDAIAKSKTTHPDFFETHNLADRLYEAKQGKDLISTMVGDNPRILKTIKHPIVEGLFGIAGWGAGTHFVGAPLATVGGAGLAGTAVMANQLAKAVRVIIKNPTALKMFKNTYGAGVAGKASLFIKDANLLGSYIDKKIDNEQKYVELD